MLTQSQPDQPFTMRQGYVPGNSFILKPLNQIGESVEKRRGKGYLSDPIPGKDQLGIYACSRNDGFNFMWVKFCASSIIMYWFGIERPRM